VRGQDCGTNPVGGETDFFGLPVAKLGRTVIACSL
jgi:hypothetical protein